MIPEYVKITCCHLSDMFHTVEENGEGVSQMKSDEAEAAEYVSDSNISFDESPSLSVTTCFDFLIHFVHLSELRVSRLLGSSHCDCTRKLH